MTQASSKKTKSDASPKKLEAQQPLILRAHRLMDAFSKSNDERDFFLDRKEGFIIYVDLEKSEEDLELLQKNLKKEADRYCLIPKLTFYETKKIMEGFVVEKVYDIDTKEKLIEIIGNPNARQNFLEFIYDHETEQEKWQQYYLERSRIRIIEWLRNNHYTFVFEEDLELPAHIVEQLKANLFEEKVSRIVQQARQQLIKKSGSYYSNEALNPRPKRGRPPKQVSKVETEPEITNDIFTQVPPSVRRFLYLPEIASAQSITFSEKFDSEEEFLAHLRGTHKFEDSEGQLEVLTKKFDSLRKLSTLLGIKDCVSETPDDKSSNKKISKPQKKTKPRKDRNIEK